MFRSVAISAGIAAAFAVSVVPADAQRKKRSAPPSASTLSPSVVDEMERARAAEREAMPWHFKAPSHARFAQRRPTAALGEERHLASTFDWVAVSKPLADKAGMYPDYRLYIGVAPDGSHRGVIYADGMTVLVGEEAAMRSLNEIGAFTASVEGGGLVQVSLDPVAKGTAPAGASTTESTVFYRTFAMPAKVYRMLAGLPGENRLRFLFRTPEAGLGAFAYHSRGAEADPWVYSVGYAKEMSQLIRQRQAAGGSK